MARWMTFIAVALGAALYFPKSRVVVLDTAEPALNPIRGQISKHEMRKVARELLSFEVTFKNLPDGQAAFVHWMDQRIMNEEERTDSWGLPYTLRVSADSFFVGSTGADGEPGGADDLRVGGRRDDPWR
jgi:hypothetical protein